VNYQIEVFDTYHRRIATYDEVPLMRAIRTAPDRADEIRGILPGPVTDLGHGYRVRVLLDGQLFVECAVSRVAPQWSDTRKLILDRFVYFHEVIEFEADREAREGNTKISRAFINRPIHEIVKIAINTALGPVHYLVDHNAYPDGAQREHAKFDARRTAANELEVGGISEGQWVGAARIDATAAYAKDGDTIAGLVVDGIAWPDLRLMLIDSEETSRNSHAISRHGEIADWTDDRYDASGYKLKADRATEFLQGLLDSKGIDYLELNPHQDASGEFDDRVDAFGRYLGFAYGGGECFNAATVENGHADVFLYEDGKFLVPEMELKDYFSYLGPNSESIETTTEFLGDYDVSAGLYEVLTAAAYAARGYVWSVDPELAVTFRRPLRADRVVFFDRVHHALALRSDSGPVANGLVLKGNPDPPLVDKLYTNGASIDEYGFRLRFLDYFSINTLEDADKLAAGLLDDIAYPAPAGEIVFLNGRADLRVGDVLEFRGDEVRRLEREVSGEWNDTHAGRLVGRIAAIEHEFRARLVVTTARLTSPLRSVDDPVAFIVRSQPAANSLFQFRLDDSGVGLDLGYHLD
jgi:endonuclease YncB( thermonuclease family)